MTDSIKGVSAMHCAGSNKARENGGEKEGRKGVKDRRINKKLKKEKGI